MDGLVVCGTAIFTLDTFLQDDDTDNEDTLDLQELRRLALESSERHLKLVGSDPVGDEVLGESSDQLKGFLFSNNFFYRNYNL